MKLSFLPCCLLAVILSLLPAACARNQSPYPVSQTDCEGVGAKVHEMVMNAGDLIASGHINDGFSLLSDAENIINAIPDRGENCVERQDMYRLLANKAKIYTAYKDYRNAAKYYEKSVRFAENTFDSLQMTLDLTVISCHGGDSATAYMSAKRIGSFNLDNKPYQRYAHATAYAYIEKFFGNKERSRDLFSESLEIARSGAIGKHSLLTPLSELYEYHVSQGNLDSALFYLNDYKQLAETFRTPDMMADVNKGFLRAYIQKGDTARALDAFNSYFEIIDSLYNPAGFSVLNSEYNDKNMSRANDKMMNLELKVSRFKMIIILIVSGIFIAIIVWLVCRRLIQSRKRIFFLNREIARKEAPSSKSVSERVPSSDRSRQDELMKAIEEALTDPAVYCNPDFCIAELARLVDSNTKYISQAINECTGMNFRTFINSLRIKIARVRLTNSSEYSNCTIQAVSESVGFKSTSNFIIAFKKVMGVTPSAYQKLASDDSSFD